MSDDRPAGVAITIFHYYLVIAYYNITKQIPGTSTDRLVQIRDSMANIIIRNYPGNPGRSPQLSLVVPNQTEIETITVPNLGFVWTSESE